MQIDNTEHQQRIKGLIHEPKLTWDQVNEIRRCYVMHSRTHGLKALAARYGVAINNIHKIVRGKTWKTTAGDGNVPPPLIDRTISQQITKAFAQRGKKMDAWYRQLSKLQSHNTPAKTATEEHPCKTSKKRQTSPQTRRS